VDYLKKLFSYDRWANAQYLEALSGPAVDARQLRLLSHIVAAQMLWMDRIRNRDARAPVWPDWSLSECTTRLEKSTIEWRVYVEQITPDKARITVAYKNSKGEPWESAVEDILIHVANHGTYHRAQIAALIGANGTTPPYTDYIEGVRRGKVLAE
jgi:uncharacterized damage-inducible protein DinB